MSVLKIKDSAGRWITVPALKGDKGDKGATGAAGARGPKGDSYVLTDQDKQDIANIVLELLNEGN